MIYILVRFPHRAHRYAQDTDLSELGGYLETNKGEKNLNGLKKKTNIKFEAE